MSEPMETGMGETLTLIVTLTEERDRLRGLLELAREYVCSFKCPSTWRTNDPKPPHHPLCIEIESALIVNPKKEEA